MAKKTTRTKKKSTKAALQKAKPEPRKRLSAIDAAYAVLTKDGGAMRVKEMITAMAEQGLWSSPQGKTPHLTLYAALLREISAKGKEARFRRIDRGQLEAT